MSDNQYLGNPNLKKANVAQNWTKKELIEYQKCMDSPQHFIVIVLLYVNYLDNRVSLQL